MDSGTSDKKSQNMSGSLRFVWGLRFWVWMKSVNDMKKNFRLTFFFLKKKKKSCDQTKYFTRKLAGIANKKHGGVIPHHIPVPFLGVEFESETPRISCGVCAALLATDGREAEENRGLLTDLAQESSTGVLGDVISNLYD